MGLLVFSSIVALAAGDPRPELSGPELITSRDRFSVHWTTEGADAVPGVAVDRVLDSLEAADRFYVAEGWRPALLDDGEGGSDAIDVYLHRVDINGYAHPIDVGQGDSYACWMEVDQGLANGDSLILESVAAHEYHHCVQFAYTPFSDNWMYESGATWLQYRFAVDDVLELGASVLWQNRLNATDRRIDDVGDRYEYAAFVFVKYWAEREGREPARIPALWEALAESEGDWKEAYDVEGERLWGLTLDETFLEHAVWNAFACSLDDGQHYDPHSHRCLVDASVDLSPATDTIAFTHVEDPYTARYAEVLADGDERPVSVTCGDPGTASRAGIALVAVDGSGAAGEVATGWVDEGDEVTVRLDRALDPAGSVRIVDVSTGNDPAEHSCSIARVDAVEQRGGCDTSGGSSAWVAALAALVAGRAPRRARMK